MKIDLSKPLRFGQEVWDCKSVLSNSVASFNVKENWYYCENKLLKSEERKTMYDVSIALYEKKLYQEL